MKHHIDPRNLRAPVTAGTRLFACLAAFALLAGCGGFFSDEEPPLPGERYPVLSLDEGITADPSLVGREILLPPPTAGDSWSQPGGSADNAPGHLAVARSLGGGRELQRVWEVKAGRGSSVDSFLTAPPIVADGRVYILDAEAQASAFDAASGARLWSVDLVPEEEDEDEGFGGGLAYADGNIFVSTGFGDLFALDAGDGERIWRANVGVPFRAAPTVADGRMFVKTYDNTMAAYDAATGEQLWLHQGVSEVAAILGATSPAVVDSTVIVPYSSGELVAIHADSGNVVWRDQLGGGPSNTSLAQLNDIAARPVADGGEVIVVSHAGSLVSIDLRTGQRNWSQDVNGIQTPWVAGDYIYVLLSDGQLVCIEREGGGIVWVRPLETRKRDGETPIAWAGPVLVGDALLLVSSHRQAAIVSPFDGEILSTQDLEGEGYLAPVVAGETIYILTDNARLTAYR